MEKWKREYDQIAVPENVKERMEEAVMRAKESKKRRAYLSGYRKT